MSLLDSLRWRYATKTFDASAKLSDGDVTKLLEALRLTPTSFGLQPYKFIVIEDAALRAKLRSHAWNQPQVTDASHLIAICAKDTLTEADIDAYLDDIARTRSVERPSLHGYREMMLGFIRARSVDDVREWIMHQSYIALGVLLCACADLNIDACPMEGFDRAQVQKLLQLTGTGYSISTLCPVGKRSPADGMAHAAKVRFPLESLVDRR